MKFLSITLSVWLIFSAATASGQSKYSKAEYDRWVKSQQARGSWVMPYAEWKSKMESIDNYKPSPPAAPAKPVQQFSGRVVGQAYDRTYNANIYLYDSPCEAPQLAGQYPLWWEAKSPSGDLMSNGCYTANRQNEVVTMIGPSLQPMTLRFSDFGQGSGGSAGGAYNSFRDFILRFNDNVNQQRQAIPPPVNLTPGMTGGNSPDCLKDQRGNIYCK